MKSVLGRIVIYQILPVICMAWKRGAFPKTRLYLQLDYAFLVLDH